MLISFIYCIRAVGCGCEYFIRNYFNLFFLLLSRASLFSILFFFYISKRRRHRRFWDQTKHEDLVCNTSFVSN